MRKIDMSKPVATICYGKRDEWESRWAAADFFAEAMMNSDGSEQARYVHVLNELLGSNRAVATDGVDI